jgi:hypothetical protein
MKRPLCAVYKQYLIVCGKNYAQRELHAIVCYLAATNYAVAYDGQSSGGRQVYEHLFATYPVSERGRGCGCSAVVKYDIERTDSGRMMWSLLFGQRAGVANVLTSMNDLVLVTTMHRVPLRHLHAVSLIANLKTLASTPAC